jgi:SAM-dependent methyltransferase
MIKTWLIQLFSEAMALNRSQILQSLPRQCQSLLDLGCDDGAWTLLLGQQCRAESIHGIEIVEDRANQARAKGIQVLSGDLSKDLPIEADGFDVVHANQVIEHVPDVDQFAAQIYRALKPGGVAIVSTENTSSWHNVFAALLGWQIFSLTNLSEKRLGIGNPLALHRGENNHLKSWTHKVLFSYRGLKEFFECHGFEVTALRGAGYYPLPAIFGKWDPRHAHFITVVARKPISPSEHSDH